MHVACSLQCICNVCVCNVLCFTVTGACNYNSHCVDCGSCLNNTGASIYRPNGTEFMHYLPWFLNSNPDTTACSQGSVIT